MSEHQRLTLVSSSDLNEFDWNDDANAASRLAFIDSGPLLKLATNAALYEASLDVERLIIDHGATADVFLEILAALPAEFSGDVLRIDDRGASFLSATGRGGDRVLYALKPQDVRFYLVMHDLVRTTPLEMIA